MRLLSLLSCAFLVACAADALEGSELSSHGIAEADPSSPRAAPSAERPATTFENAVVRSSCPDPGVLRVDDDDGGEPSFVMVCTGGRFRIRHSNDLVTWRDTGESIFPEGKPPWAINGKRDWAPEIHRVGDRYVAYYTAADERDKLAIGAAYADHPLGPYTDLGRPMIQHPIGVIDATYFADDDGRKYLYWKVDGNQRRGGATPIMGRELADDGLSFAPDSTAKEVFDRGAAWEGPLVEAPWLVKRGGTYYMFYSGDVYDERYKTGVARADAPLATFTRHDGPILENNAAWVGPGHGSVVSFRGNDWFVHHAWPTDDHGQRLRDQGRWVLLDKVVWRDGWPSFAGGTSATEPQPAP